MLTSQDLSFSQILHVAIFNQLGELLIQMAQEVGNTGMVMTEAILARTSPSERQDIEKFTLVVSQGFTALLIGKYNVNEEKNNSSNGIIEFELINGNSNGEKSLNPIQNGESSFLQTQLTFSTTEISTFIQKLQTFVTASHHIYENLNISLQKILPNDPGLQSKFTILLLNLLISQKNPESDLIPIYPNQSTCKPIENALQKQIAQEKLLNDVTRKIRKSLDLSVIMTSVVEQVRKFLELDRLVIYKFEDSTDKTHLHHLNLETKPETKGETEKLTDLQNSLEDWHQYRSCIIYEARASNDIPSVLNYQEVNCFNKNSQCWEKYNQGFTLAIDDVDIAYAADLCLLEFFHSAQIRAKLAVPIIYEDKLWGLLIAHNCNGIRHWQETEKNCLSQIAEQLSIAIHQAELMRSLTEEKENLEERVIERTIALHDALVAAEAASKIRSEFIATISHELLTPLTHIIGMSSTLLRAAFGRLTKRQRDYLEKIHHSGDRLQEMIYDILDISQIEAGKAALNITDFSLVSATQKVIQSLREKADHKKIYLNIEEIIPEDYMLTADEKRVKQIFWNILSNAIKFTPEAGNVTVRLWIEDDHAILQVEDTGIGIAEDQQPLLFEKFHQLHNPYRRTYEGTGLGLALTKQLVDLHRGRIEVDSTENVGSIFTVWIPHLRK
jgi:two-component system, sensor histidine kinase and response regulator